MPSDSLLQYLQPWQERAPYRAPDNPYLPPWAYPEWTARNGDLRAPAERPKDWSAPIAEAISPTMGAYGLGQGLGSAVKHGQEGDWRGAAGEAALLAAGAIMPGPKAAPKQGIRAYHGSPHDFNRFSMDNVGTGQGQQTYGHGLYFAEAEDVAKQYRDVLGSKKYNGEKFNPQNPEHIVGHHLNMAHHDGFTGDEARQIAMHTISRHSFRNPRYAKALEMMEAGYIPVETNTGRLYEVRIDAEPADFLDWDKPLAQQSEKVRGAVEQELRRYYGSQYEPQIERYAERPVRDVLADVNPRSPVDERVAGQLRDAGIPGIRYLDQGSRSSGEGTRNYVLFRDDIIEIVRKYGMAGAISLVGLDAVLNATGQRNALMPEDQ